MKDVLYVLVLGSGRGPFMHCLVNLITMTIAAGIDIRPINIRGSDIISGRTKAVRMALEGGATHTFWLDDDMVFEPDLALRLIEHDKDIVVGNAVMKDMTFRPLASTGPNDEDRAYSIGKTGLQQITGAGLAIAMIKADVYRNIEFPWFGHRWHHVAHVEKPVFGVPNWDEWKSQFEDSWFFSRCFGAGIDVWLDHDVSQKIGHWGGIVFFPEGVAVV